MLAGQVQERQGLQAQGRDMDQIQQRQHFESWGSFWGRPGCGAPKDSTHKENLMKMLHYPDNVGFSWHFKTFFFDNILDLDASCTVTLAILNMLSIYIPYNI